MMEEYFEEFKGHYIEMGIPARLAREVNTEEQYFDFINRFKDYNLYTTVYGLKEPANYRTAIIDRLFFEFDADDGEFTDELVEDVRKCLRWMLEWTDMRPQLFFSGRRGIHVVVHFNPVELMNDNKCLQKIIENISKLSGCEWIDFNARNGAAQMRRIPNSKHQKSGLYAIPLTVEEVLFLNAEEIMLMAKTPRHEWFTPELSKDVPDVLKELDHRYELSKLAYKLKEPIKVEEPEECIAVEEVKDGVDYGNRDYALVGLVHYLRNNSFNQEEALNYLLHEWLPKNNPEPGDDQWVQYKVQYHWERKNRHCSWFHKSNIPLCEKCPFRKQLEVEEEYV